MVETETKLIFIGSRNYWASVYFKVSAHYFSAPSSQQEVSLPIQKQIYLGDSALSGTELIQYLKRQCHEIFDTDFDILKNSTRAPFEQAKTVSQIFLFLRRYREKTNVPVVVD